MDTSIQVTVLFLWRGSLSWTKPPANIWLAGFRPTLMPGFYTNCTPPVESKNKDANQWTENWHWISSQRKPKTLRLGLCGRVEPVMPLQLFHSNLTYASLCTITSFEALIKASSSSMARKQQQKQRNKWFRANPSLMFTSSSSRTLRLPIHAAYLLFFFTLLTSTPLLFPSFSPIHWMSQRLTNPLVNIIFRCESPF